MPKPDAGLADPCKKEVLNQGAGLLEIGSSQSHYVAILVFEFMSFFTPRDLFDINMSSHQEFPL